MHIKPFSGELWKRIRKYFETTVFKLKYKSNQILHSRVWNEWQNTEYENK